MGTNAIGLTEWERDFDPKTEQPYVRCKRCGGSGDHPGDPPGNQECPECDGSGWLTPSQEVNSQGEKP